MQNHSLLQVLHHDFAYFWGAWASRVKGSQGVGGFGFGVPALRALTFTEHLPEIPNSLEE